MRRIATALTILLAASVALASSAGADDTKTYEIEMFNAFGLVEGSDVRVAGVNVGSVTDLGITEQKRATVTVELQGELAELGEETTCSSEPQSLIAEYFIDCEPAGDPLSDGGTVPAEQVKQTVQADLVQNTVREPYMTRFALLLNEFGTALAGNPESLNEAIRLGAPALSELERALAILADQRNMIRDLNVDSNEIMRELADQRNEVVRFIEEAGETAEISVQRREDLTGQFAVLDDFLAELEPTLGSLENLSVEQTPLLEDLRAAAPSLNTLAKELPKFNRASKPALKTLGKASVVGERAMKSARRPVRLLAKATRKGPRSTEMLADLLRDLDDPRRAVEIDQRVGEDTGRKGTEPGKKDTMGYTGLEGLLNYAYYLTLATNQFDQSGHLLHFGLYGANTGPCGEFSSGRDPDTGEPGVPKAGGGTTTDILEADRCVAWLGPNQPSINDDLGLPKYHPSVCRDGTSPERAEEELCTPPSGSSSASTRKASGGGRDRQAAGRSPQPEGGGGQDDSPSGGSPGQQPGGGGNGGRGGGGGRQLPDRPRLPELPGLGDLGDRNRGLGKDLRRGNRQTPANDLLEFLLGNR